MSLHFLRRVCFAAACGVVFSLFAGEASAKLTYVRLIPEPGAPQGHVLGVPNLGAKPAAQAASFAGRSSSRRASAGLQRFGGPRKNIMAQIDQVQTQLFQARNAAEQQYRATGNPAHVQNYQRLAQQAQQRILQLSQLRNKELNHQQSLIRGGH